MRFGYGFGPGRRRKWRGGDGPPAPPTGYQLLLGADGKYLKGADGAYLYGVAQ